MSKGSADALNHAACPSRYELLEKVGEGTYGIVWLARTKAAGKMVALKQFKPGKDGDGVSHDGVREINLLRELRHVSVLLLLLLLLL
jgi:cyclin-dependent kinase 8/11